MVPPLGGEGDLGVDAGHYGDNDRGNDATQIGISGVTVDRPEPPDAGRPAGPKVSASSRVSACRYQKDCWLR